MLYRLGLSPVSGSVIDTFQIGDCYRISELCKFVWILASNFVGGSNLTSTLPTSVLGCQVFAPWTNYLLREAQ